MNRTHCLPLLLLTLLAGNPAFANDIQRESGWSAIYGPHIPLPEPQWTPRPDRIGDRETAMLSLEGTWRFLYRCADAMQFPIDASGPEWVDLPVPTQPVSHGWIAWKLSINNCDLEMFQSRGCSMNRLA